MTAQDFSLLLALLGATALMTSWIGRWTGDAPRDVRLMFATGSGLLAAALGVFLS